MRAILNGKKTILDTLTDLDKLNYGEYSKYQLCSSKIDMALAHVDILKCEDKSMFIRYFAKTNGFKTVPAWRGVIKIGWSDTFSNLKSTMVLAVLAMDEL